MANGQKPKRRPMGKNELMMRNPVWLAGKPSPMEEQAIAKLVVDARMAFQRITAGDCRGDDPDELAVAANTSLVLAEMGHGQEYESDVKLAQDALIYAQTRANTGTLYAFTEPEADAVRLMLDLFEQLLTVCPHRVIIRGMATAADRIRRGQVVRAEWAPGTAPPS